MKRLFASAVAMLLTLSCMDLKGALLQADAAKQAEVYGVDCEVYAGEVAEFTVSIEDNVGFCNCGIVLHYDEALVPLYSEGQNGINIPDCQLGKLADDRYTAAAVNLETHTLAFGVSGVQDYNDDGMLFRVYFKVPDDAEIGTEYEIDLAMDLLSDCEQESKLSQVKTENGKIKVTGTVFGELNGERIGLIGDKSYASAGDEVEYSIDILENIGFGGLGMQVYYDERLTPVVKEDGTLDIGGGDALGGLDFTSYWEKDSQKIGISVSGAQTEIADGELFLLKFKVPDDAAQGDAFPVRIEVDYFETDGHLSLLEYTDVSGGWIAVTETTPPRDPISVVGDVNLDGELDISDVIMMSRYITEDVTVNITEQGVKNGDMNTDNRYTAEDVVAMLRTIARLEAERQEA